jgi:hypothetical protein
MDDKFSQFKALSVNNNFPYASHPGQISQQRNALAIVL